MTRELEQTRILARGERIVSVREAALADLSESIDSAALKLRVSQILYSRLGMSAPVDIGSTGTTIAGVGRLRSLADALQRPAR